MNIKNDVDPVTFYCCIADGSTAICSWYTYVMLCNIWVKTQSPEKSDLTSHIHKREYPHRISKGYVAIFYSRDMQCDMLPFQGNAGIVRILTHKPSSIFRLWINSVMTYEGWILAIINRNTNQQLMPWIEETDLVYTLQIHSPSLYLNEKLHSYFMKLALLAKAYTKLWMFHTYRSVATLTILNMYIIPAPYAQDHSISVFIIGKTNYPLFAYFIVR